MNSGGVQASVTEELTRYLTGITAVLCLIAGFLTVMPLSGDEFAYYVFSGVSVGALLFGGVYLYQTDTEAM